MQPTNTTVTAPTPTEGPVMMHLLDFLKPVSPYTQSIILDNFNAAVGEGKLDAVTLSGEMVDIHVKNLQGKSRVAKRPDELIRCDQKALNWRAEQAQTAEKNWMLRYGGIEETKDVLLGDQRRFDELLARRREYGKQQKQTKSAAAPGGRKTSAKVAGSSDKRE